MTLEELKKSTFVVGLKEVERALEKDAAVHVFVASDCDAKFSGPLREACDARGIAVTEAFTKKDLGKACGIKVKAAAAAIVKKA